MQAQVPDPRPLYQRQIDYAMAVSNALLDATGKVEQALFEATREEITKQIGLLKALGEIQKPKDGVNTLQSAIASDRPSSAVHLQSELLQIAQDTQQAIMQSLEVLELGTDASAVDPVGPWLEALSGERAGGDASNPLGAMQGMFDLWRDQMTATLKAVDAGVAQAQAQTRAQMKGQAESAQSASAPAAARRRTAAKSTRKAAKRARA